jgi:probable rRNA maturation factor
MMLDIAVEADAEWDSSIGWEALASRAVAAAVARSAFPQLATGRRSVEVSVRLAGDAEVQALNGQWRGKDKATNVLSFPMLDPEEMEGAGSDGPELMLGDVILAHGVCVSEARDKGISVADHAAHLIVHGTLHLLGHDHLDDAAAEDMEAREVRALAELGLADPYEGAR